MSSLLSCMYMHVVECWVVVCVSCELTVRFLLGGQVCDGVKSSTCSARCCDGGRGCLQAGELLAVGRGQLMRKVEAGLGDDCVDAAAVLGARVASDETFELQSSYEPCR